MAHNASRVPDDKCFCASRSATDLILQFTLQKFQLSRYARLVTVPLDVDSVMATRYCFPFKVPVSKIEDWEEVAERAAIATGKAMIERIKAVREKITLERWRSVSISLNDPLPGLELIEDLPSKYPSEYVVVMNPNSFGRWKENMRMVDGIWTFGCASEQVGFEVVVETALVYDDPNDYRWSDEPDVFIDENKAYVADVLHEPDPKRQNSRFVYAWPDDLILLVYYPGLGLVQRSGKRAGAAIQLKFTDRTVVEVTRTGRGRVVDEYEVEVHPGAGILLVDK